MAPSSLGDTAALLIAADKESWVTERAEKVHAKGKGELQTYWLQIKAGSSTGDAASIVTDFDASSNHGGEDRVEAATTGSKQGAGISRFGNAEAMKEKMALIAKSKRLVEWNTDILAKLLKQIMVRRAARNIKQKLLGLYPTTTQKDVVDTSFDRVPPIGHPIDAVKDIISLPHFNPKAFSKNVNFESIEISEVVMAQLSAFVGNIADLYQLNAFHNFEVRMIEDYGSTRQHLAYTISIVHFQKHASHVTMSGEIDMTVESTSTRAAVLSNSCRPSFPIAVSHQASLENSAT
jgi:hypothetical protein